MLPEIKHPSHSPQRDSGDSSDAEDGEVSDHATSPSKSVSPNADDTQPADPPLPTNEVPPPLPTEPPPPGASQDDGWDAIWDDAAGAFYFFNRFTNKSQWENPRVPEALEAGPPGVANHDRIPVTAEPPKATFVGGYNPAIHGDYDPNADYAQPQEAPPEMNPAAGAPGTDLAEAYAATGYFNRFTGKWQKADLNPDNHSDEQKSRRQMNAFFDVDAAANSHDGRSLRAERASKKLSKAELKAFKEKRREKKEEKRRAWLRD